MDYHRRLKRVVSYYQFFGFSIVPSAHGICKETSKPCATTLALRFDRLFVLIKPYCRFYIVGTKARLIMGHQDESFGSGFRLRNVTHVVTPIVFDSCFKIKHSIQKFMTILNKIFELMTIVVKTFQKAAISQSRLCIRREVVSMSFPIHHRQTAIPWRSQMKDQSK